MQRCLAGGLLLLITLVIFNSPSASAQAKADAICGPLEAAISVVQTHFYRPMVWDEEAYERVRLSAYSILDPLETLDQFRESEITWQDFQKARTTGDCSLIRNIYNDTSVQSQKLKDRLLESIKSVTDLDDMEAGKFRNDLGLSAQARAQLQYDVHYIRNMWREHQLQFDLQSEKTFLISAFIDSTFFHFVGYDIKDGFQTLKNFTVDVYLRSFDPMNRYLDPQLQERLRNQITKGEMDLGTHYVTTPLGLWVQMPYGENIKSLMVGDFITELGSKKISSRSPEWMADYFLKLKPDTVPAKVQRGSEEKSFNLFPAELEIGKNYLPTRQGLSVMKPYGENLKSLMIGDIITQLGPLSLVDRSPEWMADQLKTIKPKAIGAKVRRGQEEKEIPIFPTDSRVTCHSKLKPLIYCRIPSFYHKDNNEASGTTDDLLRAFDAAWQEFSAAAPPRALAIDLRNNLGGLLSEAGRMSRLLTVKQIGNETPLISTYVWKNGNPVLQAVSEDSWSVVPENPRLTSLPLLVLMNEKSASASEIVIGNVQDAQAGIVISNGTQRSYGKGSVQIIEPLPRNQGSVKVTTGYYLTAKNRSPYRNGFSPDLIYPFQVISPERMLPGLPVAIDLLPEKALPTDPAFAALLKRAKDFKAPLHIDGQDSEAGFLKAIQKLSEHLSSEPIYASGTP